MNRLQTRNTISAAEKQLGRLQLNFFRIRKAIEYTLKQPSCPLPEDQVAVFLSRESHIFFSLASTIHAASALLPTLLLFSAPLTAYGERYPHPLPGPARTFHCFRRLPAELRFKIWEAAAERPCALHFPSFSTARGSRNPALPLMADFGLWEACKESRESLLRKYKAQEREDAKNTSPWPPCRCRNIGATLVLSGYNKAGLFIQGHIRLLRVEIANQSRELEAVLVDIAADFKGLGATDFKDRINRLLQTNNGTGFCEEQIQQAEQIYQDMKRINLA